MILQPRSEPMFRSVLGILAIILGTSGLASSTSRARELQLSLIIGDTQSAAAVAAVHRLASDPDTAAVRIRVFPKLDVTAEDREFVRTSDIVIAYPRFASLVRSFADELSAAAGRGAMVVSVAGPLDPQLAQLGLTRDATLARYFDAGGTNNLVHLIRAALSRRHLPALTAEPPQPFPDFGYFDPATGNAFEDFATYRSTASGFAAARSRPADPPWPQVGVYFSRETATSGQTELLSRIESALLARQLQPVFGFGYPGDQAIPKLFQGHVAALIGLTLKIGNVPDQIIPILEQLDVPAINAIELNSQTYHHWHTSAVGLDLLERSWQVGAAEYAGAISPTVVAAKQQVTDSATGQAYVLVMPIAERVERLADRVQAWVRLRTLSPSQRRVAVIYYNYPPGRDSIGASYLNVLPDSLHRILTHLRDEGYDVGNAPQTASDLFASVRSFGNNPRPGPDAAAELAEMVHSKRVQLLPMATYRQWFSRLPQPLRKQIIAQWGDPEAGSVMTWHDDLGEAYLVLPILQYGNVSLGPQPTRGWQEDISAAYHDIQLPPHHQYLAFYLWLQQTFAADAMLHVGTHATHEWLPGKEVGFSEEDVGEVIVGSVPQLYIYIVDDVGEGLQAKRRAMATIITHQTPPLDRASLSVDLREIAGLISDLNIARDQGALGIEARLVEITERCRQKGLLTDLSISLADHQLLDDEQLEEIEHHLKRIGERLTPFGMHSFGNTMDEPQQAATADAILSRTPDLSEAEYQAQRDKLLSDLSQSGSAELAALTNGLRGGYIPAGPGGDPVRNPDALPTGKNFYGFDPARMPSAASYSAGEKLANEFLATYALTHHGTHPDRLVFNLWGTETSRHEGVIESQILSLMGVRPVWDPRGRVLDVELIAREELGRPRVDVTVVPSGLYRDLFPRLLLLLDKAVDAVKQDNHPDNPLLKNITRVADQLMAQGVAPEEARRLASVRLFSVPSGAYGAGLDHVIQAEDSWTDDAQVTDVYMNRMSHLFGQGYWGERAVDASQQDLSPQLLAAAFQGASGVIHSRSSNVYGAIDSDDFYQYLGGTSLAVRAANGGKAVETFVADLSNPAANETLTLQHYLGRELRARYLNPKWIDKMLGEGYAGARMIRQVTDNLWGWQVTVPEAVDAAKWQEFYDVYIDDRHQLDIENRFAAGSNLAAYQMLVQRMLSVIEKGYWQPEAETVERLKVKQQDLQAAVAAEHHLIAQQAARQSAPQAIELADAAPAVAAPAPSNVAEPADSAAESLAEAAAQATSIPAFSALVQGFAMETEPEAAEATAAVSAPRPATQLLALGAIGVLLIALGWFVQGYREE